MGAMPFNLGNVDYRSLALAGGAALACWISYRYYKDVAAALFLKESNDGQSEPSLLDDEDDIDIPVWQCPVTGYSKQLVTCPRAFHQGSMQYTVVLRHLLVAQKHTIIFLCCLGPLRLKD
jgi:hypothetical protein